jgi:hypothetical protein
MHQTIGALVARKSTLGELAFEAFCTINKIPFERIDEGEASTPDYRIRLNEVVVYVEVKDIVEDENFGTPVRTRTVGSHVRAKVGEAKAQVQVAARAGAPAVLLIYNALDPYQIFGTEENDFIHAMYGELTISVNLTTNQTSDSFFGRNKSFTDSKNTSFSAIGCIRSTNDQPTVVIYENAFAKNPLDYSSLPGCIKVKRVQIEEDSDA